MRAGPRAAARTSEAAAVRGTGLTPFPGLGLVGGVGGRGHVRRQPLPARQRAEARVG